MYETDKEKEDRLYRESRSLKFQARALRKKRIAEERERKELAEAANKAREEAERKAAAERNRERDQRIRAALLEFAQTVKKYKVAFDSPSTAWGGYATTPTKDAFVLIDKVSGDAVNIKTHPSGFSWD